ncbi:CHAT domain-containing protein [Actinoplanes sp. NPDC051470]|uniref:CHAT domain-containing protein n=1 Tax=Actinoplanes sp. NPDC051470 TaxID=3157224 RepID=UPI003432EFE7
MDDTERCARIACAVIGYGDVTEAIADVLSLPPALTARGTLAAGLLETFLRSADPAGDLLQMRLGDLLEAAESAPPEGARWRRTRACARALVYAQSAAVGELHDPAGALAELDRLESEVEDDAGMRMLFDSARLGLNYARAVVDGDDGAVARFPAEVRRHFGQGGDLGPEAETMRTLMSDSAELMAAVQRGEEVGDRLDRLLELSRALPPGHQLRGVLEGAGESLGLMNRIRAGAGEGAGDGERATDEELATLIELTGRPGLSTADRALAHTQVSGAALGLGEETDPDRVDLAVEHLRQAVEVTGGGDPKLVFHLIGLALGLLRRGELTNARRDLVEAGSVLQRAKELAQGPRHPHWAMINGMLTTVGQLLGDEPGFHQDGLAGLRAYVWKVLVQPDLADASVAVRSAAEDAAAIAKHCVTAGDLPGAVSALDAGRGLALFAATELRGLADRLTAAGEDDLARRWGEAVAAGEPEALPADLRREVLTALGDAADLLDPPGFGEIQRALSVVDADALVYLVPADVNGSGYALAVPAAGPPGFLPLPNLTGGLAETPGRAELCDLAWRAAMGPLIDSYLPHLPAPPPGRPHRLVLVPIGDLALVPWQAARHRDGTYAIERIALSQAVSARMLCLTAVRPPVPPDATGLIVGNPDPGESADDTLRFAGIEAYAIRESFYPGGRFLGRRPNGTDSPSGRGTRGQVRDWLTSDDLGAGATLHLACHGVVEPGAAHLVLDGGERLTAEELGLLMARAPGRAIEVVVLAACDSGKAIGGHDEAFSLGTAFLAGGARSVLCTLWKVPDASSSVMMYVFHHLLRRDALPVWAALRQAQLWMLDPRREPPDGMPRQLARFARSEQLADLDTWAAYVHWGR